MAFLLLVWTASESDGRRACRRLCHGPESRLRTKRTSGAQGLQIWGVFVWVDGGLKTPGPINLPLKRISVFQTSLPVPRKRSAAKKQWSDIKAFAGTPQIIAFGGWTYAGPFEDLYIPAPGNQEDIRVRKPNRSSGKAHRLSDKDRLSENSLGQHRSRDPSPI